MNKKSTILVVDDEAATRDILEGFLFREGYQVACTADGLEALAYVEKSPPDVVLLDVMMPDMDGYEVCRRLKANKLWRHIPVVMITGLAGREELIRGLDAGADEFLYKPINHPELRARVRSLLRQKHQYDELQAALVMREDLAHMLVHDMRTPLSAILGYSELLLLQQSLMPEYADTIAKINTQARRLNSFINDMLIVAKMEADQLILNPAETDANGLVQKVMESHKIVAQSKRIMLRLEQPSEAPRITLDTNLFQRILDNLISNALKYSPPDSEITVRLEYPDPAGESGGSSPRVRLKVLDQGIGVAEADRERIFNKYAIVALKQQGAQVGLGLAFCKMVVDAHRGRIYVEPNHPEGSIFTVEI